MKTRITIFLLLICVQITAVSWTLNKRQLCDLEMLQVGAFAPLNGFLGKEDYVSVVTTMRLKNGALWPMPITLDVDDKTAQKLSSGEILELKDSHGTLLAKLHVNDVWQPDKKREALEVFGTLDEAHPAVYELMKIKHKTYVGGTLETIALPPHYSFNDLRKTPAELKAYFKERGIDKVVAFQTRNPMHRAHTELTRRAQAKTGAHLLIQPIVGDTKPGDIDPFTRVRCYRAVKKIYPEGEVTLCTLPLAMRMGGPREALWHALIRKNYGATHFIIGRDHAGPGNGSDGKPFYAPYASQELAKKHAKEIGIEIVTSQEMVYVKEIDGYLPEDEIKEGMTVMKISGTELRRRLRSSEEIPAWLSYPEVLAELQKAYRPKKSQGFALALTGLSGSGKSTIAEALQERLTEVQTRSVSLLDGDVIRENLSPTLGFSKEERSLNVKRVGFVASEIAKSGGIALIALIAPYEEDREKNRALISKAGGYHEIYVSTPLKVCEARDVKGLYAKARRGDIKQFTGIDDPYEPPKKPDLALNTAECSVEEAVERIALLLEEKGYL
ncbi:MAG: bifunctional sulfate adenylyltransferase/adenylylsulfate kinase [Chlamydiia bacterium]|nr:bifunctional sulfate adenylyltransferase/adenylylsulfate kinase [Chlamydiia bacterium]